MFRLASSRLSGAVSHLTRAAVQGQSAAVTGIRHGHGGPVETSEEFDKRYEAFFNRQDIDGWEIRKAMNDLQGYDMVPEPKIIIAAMKACRRVDDYALAVRYLEAVREKCGPKVSVIWPYITANIKPCLDELGILTPEEMGYDKPELAMQDVYDMHS